MSLKISDEDELFLAKLIEARAVEIAGPNANEDQIELLADALKIKLESIFQKVTKKVYEKGRTEGYFDCDCW